MYFRERVRQALEKKLGARDDLEEIVNEVEAAVFVGSFESERAPHLPPRAHRSDIE